MIDFKCITCNKYVDLHSIQPTHDGSFDINSYWENRICNLCNIDYYIKENVLISYIYIVTIREQMYYWTINIKDNNSSINMVTGTIHNFDFIPNDLTPQNVKEKITKYLKFL